MSWYIDIYIYYLVRRRRAPGVNYVNAHAHATYSQLIASSKVTLFQPLSTRLFSFHNRPSLCLDSVNACWTPLRTDIFTSHINHAILFSGESYVQQPCRSLVPVLEQVWSTVTKHDCVYLGRACDSLNRSTTSAVTPARPKCFALH